MFIMFVISSILNISNTDIINQILYDYFSINGSGYTIGRIPMASCDFSPYSYTWAPVDNDFNLEYTEIKHLIKHPKKNCFLPKFVFVF